MDESNIRDSSVITYPDLWDHDCPHNGRHLVGKNEPCSWCGAVEEEENE